MPLILNSPVGHAALVLPDGRSGCRCKNQPTRARRNRAPSSPARTMPANPGSAKQRSARQQTNRVSMAESVERMPMLLKEIRHLSSRSRLQAVRAVGPLDPKAAPFGLLDPTAAPHGPGLLGSSESPGSFEEHPVVLLCASNAGYALSVIVISVMPCCAASMRSRSTSV